MAFSNPATSPWQRASILNEIITAIDKRSQAEGSGAAGTAVNAGDIIQRGSFWRGLQTLIKDLTFDEWVIAHNAGSPLLDGDGDHTPGHYDNKAAIDCYANVGTVLEAMGKTGAEYQWNGSYYFRRRTNNTAWAPAGTFQDGDVISGYLLEDMQTVLKALIWHARTGTWIASETEDEGYGFGQDADTRAAAIAAAQADWAPGTDCGGTLGDPGARFSTLWTGSEWRCALARTREKGTASGILDDTTKDLYWLTYIKRGSADVWEYDAQGDSVYDRKFLWWSTQADQASGNGGANTYISPDFLGDDNFATSPPNAPAADSGNAGWEAALIALVIDWRDWFTYY